MEEAGQISQVSGDDLGEEHRALIGDDLWDLVLSVGGLQESVERATRSLELSLLARAASDLAQKFHAIYHRHQILHSHHRRHRRCRKR